MSNVGRSSMKSNPLAAARTRRFFSRQACAGVALLACVFALPARAQQRQPAQNPPADNAVVLLGDPSGSKPGHAGPPPIRDLQPVVVTGVQPGPGLWKVSRDGHVLWIIGTLSPLPRDIQWNSREVEQAMAQSQQMLEPPKLELDADTGWLGKLTLIPSALKARRNPDGKTLQEVVTPAQYTRWQLLKQRYLGNDRGIEQWRPVFAALELYDKAIRKSGMRQGGVVGPVLDKLARKYKVEVVSLKVVVKVSEPRQALKDFARTSLDDGECFARTLDRIEGDLGTMVARANAWSIGDLETLRELPYRNQYSACSAAFGSAAIARKYGIDDIPARLQQTWLQGAQAALARNTGTVAILPVSDLQKPDGYLSRLQALGYTVETP